MHLEGGVAAAETALLLRAGLQLLECQLSWTVDPVFAVSVLKMARDAVVQYFLTERYRTFVVGLEVRRAVGIGHFGRVGELRLRLLVDGQRDAPLHFFVQNGPRRLSIAL